jgi:hypothetical protein
MQVVEDSSPDQANPVDAARVAIWRLFQEGYVDEDMATAGLLAVDLGTRRARQGHRIESNALHGRKPGRAGAVGRSGYRADSATSNRKV